MWHNDELERAKRLFRAIGAAGAQVPYKHKAGGSNPSSPTTNSETSSNGGLFRFRGSLPGFEPREGQTAQWAVCGRAGRRPAQTRESA